MRFNILAIIMLIFAWQSAAVLAGTVTLTGTCTSNPQNSTLKFALTNTGNEAAGSLLIGLHVLGTNYTSKQYNLSALQPSATSNVPIVLSRSLGNGTFAAYFLVAFQQDTNVFTATFPCVITVRNSEPSFLVLSSNVSRSNNGVSIINARLMNEGNSAINVTIGLILPPAFSLNRTGHASVLLAPYSSNTVSIPVTYQQVNGNFSGAVAAYYTAHGLSHAVMSPILINTVLSTPVASLSWLWIIIALVIVALVILIARAYLKKKGGDSSDDEDEEEEPSIVKADV